MKMIKVGFYPVGDGQIVSGTITKLRKKGDTWTVEETIAVNSDEPGREREVLLDDSQRLVIDATSNTKIVLDRSQNAAVRVPTNDPRPSATPLSTDGTEDTPSIAESAIQGVGITDAVRQEEKDKAITEARNKLKAQQEAQAQPREDAKKNTGVAGPQIEPAQPAAQPPVVQPQPASTATPTWPPKGVGGN